MMSLLQPSEELGNEVFGLLLHIVLWEPLCHYVGNLLPMVDNLLQVLLALDDGHVNHTDILHSCIFQELLPESRLALSLSPGQVEVLAHDGNVSPPGLVQGEHPQPGLSLVRADEWLNLPPHKLGHLSLSQQALL